MTLGDALAIVIASLIFAVGCIMLSRRAAAGRPLFRDPGAAAEGRNDVVFAVTILLGFLLLIAGNHYDASANAARAEATTVESVATTAQGLPDRAAREAIQHSAVCYLRTTRALDWAAVESDVGGDAGGSPVTDRWLAVLGNDVAAASLKGQDAYIFQDLTHQLRMARAERLYPGTPFSVALWMMSGLGVAIIILLVAMLMVNEYAWYQYLITIATAVILSFMLVLIASFSRPFGSEPPLPAVSVDVVNTAIDDIALAVGPNPRVMGPCRLR